ncbi:MAG: hypothetical protein IJU41_08815 [Clostridia bacterium]|nr:hypothetical protein [Clostridia bacterium]
MNKRNIEAIRPTCVLVIKAGGGIFYAHFAGNPSAASLREKLNAGGVSLELRACGGFDRAAKLPWTLPQATGESRAAAGDLVLSSGNILALYRGENGVAFTKLASPGDTQREALLAALEGDGARIDLHLEWGE